MKIYKLRRTDTGEFSSAGSSPSWHKEGGKVWSKLNHIKSHVALMVGDSCFYRLPPGVKLEIVEFEVTEQKVIDITEYIEEKKREYFRFHR